MRRAQRSRSAWICGLVITALGCASSGGVDWAGSAGVPPVTGDGWSVAEPAAVHLDGARLARMTRELAAGEWGNIHAVLVARHGELVYEEYFAGPDQTIEGPLGWVELDRGILHDIRSVSKTVTAILVGIALDQGLLASVDTPIAELLPDRRDLLTGDKASFTLRHALTMTGGFDWNEDDVPYTTLANDERAMSASDDPLGYVLGKELVAAPGESFYYSGGMTHVLASVLERATGESLAAYADRVLFTPLGIERWDWTATANVRHSSYAGLRLTGRDLAKIGQLLLDGGTWNGRRIVSEGWVREATGKRVDEVGADPTAPDFVLSSGYGYQGWWNELDTPWGALPVFTAVGNGEQRIVVIPDLSMVVAVLAGFYDDDDNWWTPERLVMEHIFAAIEDPAGAEAYDLAVTGVTLVDGTGGPARSGVSVYVRDGRIAAIAEGSLPGAAETVVDGAGKYLIPGLVDAHAHPFPVEESFPRFIHYGVTSILIPGCSVCSPENLARARELSAGGSIPAPRVFHTSQHFTMEGRHPVKTYPSPSWVEGETVYYLREPGDAARHVEAVARQPIVGIKLTIEDGPIPPLVEMIPVAVVAAVVEAAHARGLPVFAHVSSAKGLRVAEAGGADHLLHFVGVDIDWERDAEMIGRLRERDPSWVTTLAVDKAMLYPLHPEWLEAVEATGVQDAEEIARLRASRTAERSLAILGRLYPGREPTFEGILGPQVEDLRALHDRGFSLVVGTDTANAFIFPGVSVHEEMEILALAFEPAEILPMATRNAAEMLGALDEIGTLEVGKRADMVLLDADPLADIRNTRSIHTVFRDGRPRPRIEGAGVSR